MASQESDAVAASENGIQHKLESGSLLARFGLDAEPVDEGAVRDATLSLLYAIGEDPAREGLTDTPRRVARAYTELVSGYTTDPVELVNNAIFDIDCDDMVIVSNIEYYSLCEHHMLPFLGHAHVAYLPNRKIVGLSKIPRIVDMFSRRLQVQERLTRQIAEFLVEVLDPRGVAVVMTARHMCSMIRGVMKHDSNMTTSAMLGDFRNKPSTRHEFLMHVQRSKNP
ncbi:MAG: GTP cyclohydrolase I FolE [Chloroflexota bacterium]|nr:GTP cyclohydrolase I FolE [Chloroflexota bacterium]MDE2853342.1 GTP cyclohydrolase I FolE [Chloroflexota bacterium]MDE2947586.1 GTP cyclohydrolase I FolE [Chloroflexota bacterium]